MPRIRTALSFRNISALYIFAVLFVLFALWVPDTFLHGGRLAVAARRTRR